MGVLFIDGFDHWNADDYSRKWSTFSSTGSDINNVVGRLGRGQALHLVGGQRELKKTLPSNEVSVTVGTALYLLSNPSNAHLIIKFLEGGSEQVSVRFDASQKPLVSRNGTTLGTSASSLSTLTWYYIELNATINGSTGTFDLRVDGTSVASGTSQNTQATANAWADQISVLSSNGLYLDDLYVYAGTTTLGPCIVDTLYPEENGTYGDWSSNLGDGFYAVREAPEDSDTSFIYSSTATDQSTFKVQAPAYGSATVHAVQTNISARNTGSASSVKAIRRVNSTDYVTSAKATSSSYTDLYWVDDVSPDTSSAWTPSEIAASEFGVELA